MYVHITPSLYVPTSRSLHRVQLHPGKPHSKPSYLHNHNRLPFNPPPLVVQVRFPAAPSFSFPVEDSTDMEAGGHVMGAAAGGRVTGVIAIAAAAEGLGIGQMMREHLVSVLAARSV